jgi:hypothetical protein
MKLAMRRENVGCIEGVPPMHVAGTSLDEDSYW